jgi:hypothetical protein
MAGAERGLNATVRHAVIACRTRHNLRMRLPRIAARKGGLPRFSPVFQEEGGWLKRPLTNAGKAFQAFSASVPAHAESLSAGHVSD